MEFPISAVPNAVAPAGPVALPDTERAQDLVYNNWPTHRALRTPQVHLRERRVGRHGARQDRRTRRANKVVCEMAPMPPS